MENAFIYSLVSPHMTPAPEATANRLTLAYRDMDDVKRYIAAYVELDELQRQSGSSRYFDHCEAALIAAVVAYCRSFKKSESKGNASAKLDISQLDCISGNPSMQALHNLLLDRRDKAIAHADWEQHNTQLISSTETSVLRRVSVPNYAQGIEIDAFLNLAESVRSEVLAKSHTIDTALRGREGAG